MLPKSCHWLISTPLVRGSIVCLWGFSRYCFNSLKSCIQIISLSSLLYCPVMRRDARCLSENNLAHKWRNCVVVCKKYRRVKRTPEIGEKKKKQELESIPFVAHNCFLFLGSILFISFLSNHFMLGLCRLRQTHIPEIAR